MTVMILDCLAVVIGLSVGCWMAVASMDGFALEKAWIAALAAWLGGMR